MFFKIINISALLAILIVGVGDAAHSAMTFGVVPQQSAKKLARKWGPICAYWSQKSGLDIRFATAPDIPEFERRLANGVYDVAYMNPYHYTVFCRQPGYLAVAKQKDKRISGIIVVHKDAPYQHLDDLAGKTIAFPSPAAFAASILTRTFFKNAGIPITPKYVKSHDSVYRTVAMGFYAAGGGVVRTLQNTEVAVSHELRILWKTQSFTPHAFAVHPRVSQADRHRILSAMLMMNDDVDAQSLLTSISFNGFATANDKDWDDIRALSIELLDALIEQ